MASYVYRCPNGHEVVVSQPITDEVRQAVKCDKCGKTATRVWEAPAITFNGTGWGREAR
jgi:hypothetical protein